MADAVSGALVASRMPARRVRRFPSSEQVSQAAAEAFIRIAGDAVTKRGRFTVVLSGGSTPRRLYEILAASPYSDRVVWGKVEFFWGDERAVPPDHRDSNYRMAYEALLGRINIADTQVHRMPAERKDREDAAWDYQVEIARVFGVDPNGEPPHLDLVLLGMGADGHTASLFPYTEGLKEETRWVVSNYAPNLDSYRLTMTPPILNRTAHVIFLVVGADKAKTLAQVLEGSIDTNRLPAQLIKPEEGELTWLIDEPAASELCG